MMNAAFEHVMSPADARTKGLLASGARACVRARMKNLNCSRRKETLRGGAAGWQGRSRAVCGGGHHASALGRWRTEPEVSNLPRILLGKKRFSRAAIREGTHSFLA